MPFRFSAEMQLLDSATQSRDPVRKIKKPPICDDLGYVENTSDYS